MDGKVMDSAMEAAARAVYRAMGDEINGSEDIARAAIAAYLAAKEAEGFVMVPVEPTREMIYTGTDKLYENAPWSDCVHVWSAMIAARPREEDR